MLIKNKNKNKKYNDIYYVPTTENLEKENKKGDKNKRKEREKRIKKNKEKLKEIDKFDYDMETVINMTNKNNQKKQQERKIKQTKQQQKQLKKKKRIKKFIKLVIIILLIIIGGVFALVSPIFNIAQINVVNNNQISKDTIISLSNISVNENIFSFNIFKSEYKIKQNAYIEEAKIKRKFPNKVEIDVKEREKSFNVEFLNEFAYINNQGYILEISEIKDVDLPLIQGIETDSNEVKEGNRLNEKDLEKLEVVLQIINISENYNLQDKITSIDISNSNNYSLYLEEDRKTIYLGDGNNLNTKILWIPAILQDNEGVEGYIYLNDSKARFEEKV